MEYKVKDFDYDLPVELIAQEPAKPRDHSRLLLLDKSSGKIEHHHFYDLPDFLKPGDLLVLNDSKVFPARLHGHRQGTGGRLEVLLHRQLEKNKSRSGYENNNIWECLVKGSVRVGQVIEFDKGLIGQIVKALDDGTRIIEFNISRNRFWILLDKIGEVPLPPYIKRPQQEKSDKKNYQTVYADKDKVGSAAAPTAGLHFTKQILKKIQASGVKITYVTLHVGLGTFAPVKAEKISDHHMHKEFVSVSASAQRAVLDAKRRSGRVIAIGTTSCRTLESCDWDSIERAKRLSQKSFWTDIFIYPGYNFQAVDALLTNFHLPQSTLLMLVSALAGKDLIDKAYKEALSLRYRFFSYGDAMFIY